MKTNKKLFYIILCIVIFFNFSSCNIVEKSSYELLYEYLDENEFLKIDWYYDETLERTWDTYNQFQNEFFELYISENDCVTAALTYEFKGHNELYMVTILVLNENVEDYKWATLLYGRKKYFDDKLLVAMDGDLSPNWNLRRELKISTSKNLNGLKETTIDDLMKITMQQLNATIITLRYAMEELEIPFDDLKFEKY